VLRGSTSAWWVHLAFLSYALKAFGALPTTALWPLVLDISSFDDSCNSFHLLLEGLHHDSNDYFQGEEIPISFLHPEIAVRL
jgi:hypothetical protein